MAEIKAVNHVSCQKVLIKIHFLIFFYLYLNVIIRDSFNVSVSHFFVPNLQGLGPDAVQN